MFVVLKANSEWNCWCNRRANEVLATETHMFEKFFRRVEPKIETSAASGRQTSTSVAYITSSHVDVAGSRLGGRKRSKSRASNIDRALHLNAEQKCEIVQRELEEYAEEVRIANEESEKQVDELKVSYKLLIILLLMLISHSLWFDVQLVVIVHEWIMQFGLD